MITATNIQKLPNLDFPSYQKLPGYSFSFLKREINGIAPPVQSTDKIELGKLVDAILTAPWEVNMNNKLYSSAKAMAALVQEKFGYALQYFEKQVSYTGTLKYGDFTIPFKGRPDYLLPGHFIVDLKVTATRKVQEVCNFMRYEDQLFGYGKLAGVPLAYLLIYSVPLRDCKLIKVPIGDNNLFFENKITKFGTVDNFKPIKN